LIVASERQIAANRRNAGKSTGPRSPTGKMRASRNAYRHGLTLSLSGAELTERVKELARMIAGDSSDWGVLEHARTAAEAELELARVRRVKLALIERVSALGCLRIPTHFRSAQDEVRWLIARDNWETEQRGVRPEMPRLQDPALTMPHSEPHRSSEAMRRLLPELTKLNRFEIRSVRRRDQAIRNLGMRKNNTKS
jgi:hypothetical protein